LQIPGMNLNHTQRAVDFHRTRISNHQEKIYNVRTFYKL